MPTTLEIRAVLLIAAATAGVSGCSEPADVPTPVMTAVAVAATNGQTAVAGSTLPRPLTVLVETDGTPAGGVTVTWQASTGTLGRTTSVTGQDGITTSAWRLGADIGVQSATATVAGVQGSPVAFTARATPQIPNPVDSTPVPASVYVSPSSVQIAPGQSYQLTATVLSSDGTPLGDPITGWESVDSTVATVTQSGLLVGVRLGSTTITARSGDLEILDGADAAKRMALIAERVEEWRGIVNF